MGRTTKTKTQADHLQGIWPVLSPCFCRRIGRPAIVLGVSQAQDVAELWNMHSTRWSNIGRANKSGLFRRLFVSSFMHERQAGDFSARPEALRVLSSGCKFWPIDVRLRNARTGTIWGKLPQKFFYGSSRSCGGRHDSIREGL